MTLKLENEDAQAAEWVLKKYVMGAFDNAAKKFREAPTPVHYTALTEAMMVRQAWQYVNSVSNRHSYEHWLLAMSDKPVTSDLNQMIWERSHGTGYGDLAHAVARAVDFPV